MSKVYRVLGLMSGTSLDGVDAAIIETDGERIFDWDVSRSIDFHSLDRKELQTVTDRARDWNFVGPEPNVFIRAERHVDDLHMRAIDSFLTDEGIEEIHDISLIGYHGQTVLHDAEKGRTLQLGDGQSLADHFGVPCVYDFRTEDVAAGGQGAPLAPIYHKALVAQAGLAGVTAVLNLGGVGNVTIIAGNEILATDTGPANGPLDSFLEQRGLGLDIGGSMSEAGVADFETVDRWLKADFFQRDWPKSADRYDFDVIDDLTQASVADGAATLCAFTALSAARTIGQMGRRPDRVIVCGGGRRNRTIMTMLALELGCPVQPAEAFGWDSDAIEAQAFAFLAVRVLLGLPNSFPTTTGVPVPTVGGQIAYPSSSRGSRGGE